MKILRQIIEDTNKELKKISQQLSANNGYKCQKYSAKRYEKYSKYNLIRAILYRHMILQQQKKYLNETRYKYKRSLQRLRKALIENYMMKDKIKHPRNFSFASYKKITSKGRGKKK